MNKRGKKPMFSAKQVERMRDMKSEGLRIPDIARLMGAATSTISAYLRGERIGHAQGR